MCVQQVSESTKPLSGSLGLSQQLDLSASINILLGAAKVMANSCN